MNLSLRKYFEDHPGFEHKSDLFVQKNPMPTIEFESHYLSLRKHEGRIYDDQLAAKLPEVPKSHPLRKEWTIRANSLRRLNAYLKERKQIKSLIEIGCGNGWLIRNLSQSLDIECMGLDVNMMELEQAVRLSLRRKNQGFVYGDIFSENFAGPLTDIIVMASAIQYFQNASSLIHKLLTLLHPGGEIHILDSPLYDPQSIQTASERSRQYFKIAGFPEMEQHYYHHRLSSFESYGCKVLYDPRSLTSLPARVMGKHAPFPWIRILHSELKNLQYT